MAITLLVNGVPLTVDAGSSVDLLPSAQVTILVDGQPIDPSDPSQAVLGISPPNLTITVNGETITLAGFVDPTGTAGGGLVGPEGEIVMASTAQGLTQTAAGPTPSPEQGIEPGAGGPGGPGGVDAGGSSLPVAEFLASFFNEFGLSPTGDFNPFGLPGFEVPVFDEFLTLTLEEAAEVIVEIAEELGEFLLFTDSLILPDLSNPGAPDDFAFFNELGAPLFNPDGTLNLAFDDASGSSGLPFDLNITHAMNGDDTVELADKGNPNGNNLKELFGEPTAFYGGTGDDTLTGGNDHDIIVGDGQEAGNLAVDCGHEKDHQAPVVLTGNDDTLDGGIGNDVLLGDGLLSKPGLGIEPANIGFPNLVLPPTGGPAIESDPASIFMPVDLKQNFLIGMFGAGGVKNVLDIEVEKQLNTKIHGGHDTLIAGEGDDLAVGDALIVVEGRESNRPLDNGDYEEPFEIESLGEYGENGDRPGGPEIKVKGGDDTIEGNEGADKLVGDGIARLPSALFGDPHAGDKKKADHHDKSREDDYHRDDEALEHFVKGLRDTRVRLEGGNDTLIGDDGSAPAANIAVFDNGDFVDTDDELGIPEAVESEEIQANLTLLGHNVMTFTGITASEVAAALAGKDVLVIPEQEISDLADALTEDALDVMRAFVRSGGKLVIAGDFTSGPTGPNADGAADLMNALFDYGVTEDATSSSDPSVLTDAGAATRLGLGATLPDLIGTTALSDLPPGATSVYEDADGNSTVALIPEGQGEVVFFGWDWFGSINPEPGSQDVGGDWSDLLDAAVRPSSDDVLIGDGIVNVGAKPKPSGKHLSGKVAVFDDPAFVNTDGSSFDESDEVQASLEDRGHQVRTFEGISAEALAAGLKGKHVLLIPTLDKANPDSNPFDLSEEALDVIRDFVRSGGRLIVHGTKFDSFNTTGELLNDLFGYAVDENPANNPLSFSAAAKGTIFEKAPSSIDTNISTRALANLPENGKAIYTDADGEATVALFEEGHGEVVYLGWNWASAAPSPGSQDDGWLDILDLAASPPAPGVYGGDDTLIGGRGADKMAGDGLINVVFDKDSVDDNGSPSPPTCPALPQTEGPEDGNGHRGGVSTLVKGGDDVMHGDNEGDRGTGMEVALWNDPAFFDVDQESAEIEASLRALGQRVTTFTGISAAEIAAALDGKNILVVPEFDNNDGDSLIESLDEAARDVLRDFVRGGGKLILSGKRNDDTPDFINELFLHLTEEFRPSEIPSSHLTGNEVGTPFEGGPEILEHADATANLINLPENATSIYENDQGGTSVAVFDEGLGQLIFLGYDWFNARPAPGDQDGGWIEVLRRAVEMDTGANSDVMLGDAILNVSVGDKDGGGDESNLDRNVEVLVFSDDAFTDNGGSEPEEIRGVLDDLEHNVMVFGDVFDDLAQALVGKEVFIIPQLDGSIAENPANYTDDFLNDLRDFVNGGGTLIVTGSNTENGAGDNHLAGILLNELFNYGVTEDVAEGGDHDKTTEADSTFFSGAPETLGGVINVHALTGLPTGATSIYENQAGNSTVALFEASAGTQTGGKVVYIGYDWFTGEDNIDQDWDEVLDFAVQMGGSSGGGDSEKEVVETVLEGGDDSMFGGAGGDRMVGDAILDSNDAHLLSLGYGQDDWAKHEIWFDEEFLFSDLTGKKKHYDYDKDRDSDESGHDAWIFGGNDLMVGGGGDDLIRGDGLWELADRDHDRGQTRATQGGGDYGEQHHGHKDSPKLVAADKGFGGNDLIFGGTGNDTAWGEGGADLVVGDGLATGIEEALGGLLDSLDLDGLLGDLGLDGLLGGLGGLGGDFLGGDILTTTDEGDEGDEDLGLDPLASLEEIFALLLGFEELTSADGYLIGGDDVLSGGDVDRIGSGHAHHGHHGKEPDSILDLLGSLDDIVLGDGLIGVTGSIVPLLEIPLDGEGPTLAELLGIDPATLDADAALNSFVAEGGDDKIEGNSGGDILAGDTIVYLNVGIPEFSPGPKPGLAQVGEGEFTAFLKGGDDIIWGEDAHDDKKHAKHHGGDKKALAGGEWAEASWADNVKGKPVTVEFDGPPPFSEFDGYSEAGFTFQNLDDEDFTFEAGFDIDDEALSVIKESSAASRFHIVRGGGVEPFGPFSLLSFDLVSFDVGSGSSVTFTGLDMDGDPIEGATFKIDSGDSVGTYELPPAFMNVNQVLVEQDLVDNGDFFNFDNFVLREELSFDDLMFGDLILAVDLADELARLIDDIGGEPPIALSDGIETTNGFGAQFEVEGGQDTLIGGRGQDLIYGDAVILATGPLDDEDDGFLLSGSDPVAFMTGFGGFETAAFLPPAPVVIKGGDDMIFGDQKKKSHKHHGDRDQKTTTADSAWAEPSADDDIVGDGILAAGGLQELTGGNDSIWAGDGNDVIVGDGIFSDMSITTIITGGDDVIDGGKGNDLIYGDGLQDGGASKSTFSTNPFPDQAIPDSGMTTSTIEVSGLTGSITDVNVFTEILHAASGDLDITVISPEGTEVNLALNRGGATADVFNGTTWDDTSGFSVFGGLGSEEPSLRPEEMLATFIGENPNGTWTLKLSDDVAGNTGSLDSWSLTIETDGDGDFEILDASTFGVGRIQSDGLVPVSGKTYQGGNDDLQGGKGDDTVYGEGGDDTVDGGANADIVFGGVGSDLGIWGDPFAEFQPVAGGISLPGSSKVVGEVDYYDGNFGNFDGTTFDVDRTPGRDDPLEPITGKEENPADFDTLLFALSEAQLSDAVLLEQLFGYQDALNAVGGDTIEVEFTAIPLVAVEWEDVDFSVFWCEDHVAQDLAFGDNGDNMLVGSEAVLSDGEDLDPETQFDNMLVGLGGDDELIGDEGGEGGEEIGDDILLGHAGLDTLLGDVDDNLVGQDGGDDKLIGGADSDLLVGDTGISDGNDLLGQSGEGGETRGGDDKLFGDFFDPNTSEVGVEGNDLLYGDAFDNIVGEGGAETARGGDDLLVGGGGLADTLVGDAGGSITGGMGGDDRLYGDYQHGFASGGADVLYGDARLVLSSGAVAGNDLLVGGGNNDALFGDAGSSISDSQAGDDTLIGDFDAGAHKGHGHEYGYGPIDPSAGGNDRLFGDGNFDLLPKVGADSTDVVAGNDKLIGDSRLTVGSDSEDWHYGLPELPDAGIDVLFGDVARNIGSSTDSAPVGTAKGGDDELIGDHEINIDLGEADGYDKKGKDLGPISELLDGGSDTVVGDAGNDLIATKSGAAQPITVAIMLGEVDVNGRPDFRESQEVRDALEFFDYQTNMFSWPDNPTGSDVADAIIDGIKGADVLLVPNQQFGGDPSLLEAILADSTVADVIRGFVQAGGKLIIHGDVSDDHAGALNEIFGFNLEDDFVQSTPPNFDQVSTITPEAAGTIYAGLPETIVRSGAGFIDGLVTSRLPGNATSIYESLNDDGTQTVSHVVLFEDVGDGSIVYLGYNFQNSLPPPGEQDGGWLEILNRSVHMDQSIGAPDSSFFAVGGDDKLVGDTSLTIKGLSGGSEYGESGEFGEAGRDLLVGDALDNLELAKGGDDELIGDHRIDISLGESDGYDKKAGQRIELNKLLTGADDTLSGDAGNDLIGDNSSGNSDVVAEVAVFANEDFVSLTNQLENTLQALSDLGHNATTFTGISDSDFETALAGKDALVIPNLLLRGGDTDGLGDALSPEAVTVIAGFLLAGGKLILTGPQTTDVNADFLNDLFGIEVLETGITDDPGSFAVRSVSTDGTIFDQAPSTLPVGTDFTGSGAFVSAITRASFVDEPAGSANRIFDAPNPFSIVNPVVATFDVDGVPDGDEQVIYLGWSWSDTATGEQDADWNAVLDLAVTMGASGEVGAGFSAVGGNDTLIGDSQLKINGSGDEAYESWSHWIDGSSSVDLPQNGDDTMAGDALVNLTQARGGDDVLYGDHHIELSDLGKLEHDLKRQINGLLDELNVDGVGKHASLDELLELLLDNLGGDDVMFGDALEAFQGSLGGNDTLYGQGGDDTMSGDADTSLSTGFGRNKGGNDALFGGGGSDTIAGDFLSSFVSTDGGDDEIHGGAGDDLIYGETRGNIAGTSTGSDAGNDDLYGGAGDDSIFGDSGGNVDAASADFGAFTSTGDDRLDGGAGNDLLAGDARFRVEEGTIIGNDTLTGGRGDDVLYGDAAGNNIGSRGDVFEVDDRAISAQNPVGGDGLGGDDTLDGGQGTDTIFGGGGSDLGIWRGADHSYGGPDVYDGGGGTGSDVFSTDESDFDEGTDGDNTMDTLRLILTSEQFDDHRVWDEIFALRDQIAAGDDDKPFSFFTLDGVGDPDGDPGDIDLTVIEWEKIEISLEGCEHVLTIDPTDDSLFDLGGADFLLGTRGVNDIVFGLGGSDDIVGDALTTSAGGALGDDVLVGGLDNDTILGDENANLVGETGGNDKLFGGEGGDTIVGDTGVGKMLGPDIGTPNTEIPIEVALVDGADGVHLLNGALGGDDLINGGPNIGRDNFGDGTNVLFGDAYGDIRLMSAGGNDSIDGGQGMDVIYGDAGGDIGDDGESDSGTDPLVIPANGVSFTRGGDDRIAGDGDEDMIFGDAGGSIIGTFERAEGGSDFIVGDQLNISTGVEEDQPDGNLDDGPTGNDFIFGDASGDIVGPEAAGGDDVIYGDNYTLFEGSDAQQVGIDIGGLGFDKIVGDAGFSLLDGAKGGDDLVFGQGGNDDIVGDAFDGISGSGTEAGDDILFGGGATGDESFSPFDLIDGDTRGSIEFDALGGDDIIAGDDGQLYNLDGSPYVTRKAGFSEAHRDIIRGDAGGTIRDGGRGGNDLLVGDHLAMFAALDLYGDGYDESYGDSYGPWSDHELPDFGQAASDTIIGDSAAFIFDGGVGGDDVIYGDHYILYENASGNRTGTVIEGGEADRIYGDTEGSITEGGRGGNDEIHGQGGDDTIAGDSDGGIFFGFAPDDDAEVIATAGGNDEIHGGDGNDFISGDTLFQIFNGGSGGNDTIYGGDGEDTATGDAADDLFDFGGFGGEELISVVIDGSSFISDFAIEDAAAGDDWLFGGRDNDWLYGDAIGSAASFGFLVDTRLGNDDLWGEEGDDRIYGDVGRLLFGATGGNDLAYGGEGDDIIVGDAGDDIRDNLELSSAPPDGRGGNDELIGGKGDDTIVGDAGDALMDGAEGGDDILSGDEGNDTLIGDAGLDESIGDIDPFKDGDIEDNSIGGNDTLIGGSGEDLLIGDAVDDLGDTSGPFSEDTGINEDRSRGGNDTLLGGSDDDILVGDAGDDIDDGAIGGDDLLKGEEGDDVLYGDAREEISDESTAGNDTLFGGWGEDVLIGDAGEGITSDSLAGDDLLDGGKGDDILWGDVQGDFGFGGADTFVAWLTGNGDDTIKDFEIGIDTLRIADVTDLNGGGADITDLMLNGASASSDGSDVTISFDDGGSVTIEGLGIPADPDLSFAELAAVITIEIEAAT